MTEALSSPDAIRAELDRREKTRIKQALARRNYRYFVPVITPKYDMRQFHTVMADHLDRFAKGEIKRLMITCPPQHGKSELSTRNFPPYLWGRNPALKLAVLSYGADKAQKFSREIQQKIDSPEYRAVFPGIRLATGLDKDATRTQREFDIVGTGGSLKAVGRRGALTGDPVDIAILDDLLKDEIEAQSPTIREQAWGWIESVVDSRLHNESQILYVTTRWHEDDPAGRFLDQDGHYSEDNPDGWVLLNFAALKTSDVVPYDNRAEGEALWPEKHSQRRMEKKRKDSSLIFNALYQGDPKPSEEAIIFSSWSEIDSYPDYIEQEFVGLDFGFSKDPTAADRIGVVGRNIYIDELFYETEMNNQDILERLHLCGLPSGIEIICDGAEPKSISELKRGFWKPGSVEVSGVNARACEKGPGSINAGISKLSEYSVFFTKRSRNVKKERDNYAWVMANGKATNQPIGLWNHHMDAIRSAVYTKLTKPRQKAVKARTYASKKGRSY